MKKHTFIKTFLTLAAILSIGVNTLAAASLPSRKVTLSQHNVTLSEVMSKIETQTDYLFIAEEGVNLKTKVSLDVTGQDISDVMDAVTKGTDIAYAIEGNYVMLSEKNISSQSTQSTAPKSTIKGSVKDESGEILIGVHVFIKGTDFGGFTDIDGNYSIEGNFPQDAALTFEFMGMKTKSIAIESRKVIDVIMQADQELLDEVVVVGYGSESKINLTGSVASVKATAVQNRSIANVSSALQGLVPGMTITQAGGSPGQDVGTIRVRGVGSFNNCSPLVLIDGVEGNIDVVDPQDIESISVLKDASSAAIYGSKAANGVILITTKRGKMGAPRVTYSGMVAWSNPTDLMEQTTSAEYAQLSNEAAYWEAIASGMTEAEARAKMPYSEKDIELFENGTDPDGHPNTDWYGLFFTGSGFSHKHNVNISGGTEAARYNASLGYNKRNGIIQNASNEQFNFRVNGDFKISDKLSVRTDLSYTNTYMMEPTNAINWNGAGASETTYRQVYRISPMVPYKKSNGDYGYMPDGNPIAWQDMGMSSNTGTDYMNAFGEFTYEILDGLKLKANGSYNIKNISYTQYREDIWYDSVKYDGPIRLKKRTEKEIRKQAEILLTYDKKIQSHTLNFLAGFHADTYDYEQLYAFRKTFASSEITDLDGGSVTGQETSGYTRSLAMNSFFGRAKYNYADKYLMEANLRVDGTSRFDPEYRWGFFPSVSAAWRISNEDFMASTRDVISDMKIRGSWGILGNQDVNDYYPYINTYTLTAKYPFDDAVQTGAAITSSKKRAISWESTRTYGAAIDATLFNSLDVTIEYYNKKTYDILMSVSAPSTFGYSGYTDNVGEMLNTGFELSLNYHKAFGEFLFNVGGNFAYNHNEILALDGRDEIISGRFIQKVGEEYNSYYVYKSDGLYQSQAEIDNGPDVSSVIKGTLLPGDIKLVDVNNDGKITADDRIVLTSENPKYTFAFNLGLQWRGFDMTAFFQGAAGVSRYFTDEAFGEINGDAGHPAKIWMNRWTPENPDNDWPRASKMRSYNTPDSGLCSDFWFFKTNYLRLKDFQVGYTLPSNVTEWLHIASTRIYYDATNLLTFKSCPQGIDPEAKSGWGANYPHVTTHSFGVTISF